MERGWTCLDTTATNETGRSCRMEMSGRDACSFVRHHDVTLCLRRKGWDEETPFGPVMCVTGWKESFHIVTACADRSYWIFTSRYAPSCLVK